MQYVIIVATPDDFYNILGYMFNINEFKQNFSRTQNPTEGNINK